MEFTAGDRVRHDGAASRQAERFRAALAEEQRALTKETIVSVNDISP